MKTEQPVQNLTQSAISSVTLRGNTETDFIQIFSGLIGERELYEAYETGNYTPVYTEQTYFLADFSNGLNAGLILSGGGDIDGYTIYRQRGSERIVRVADVSKNVSSIYDYTIRNQRGPYRWSVYAKSNDSFVTDAIESDEVSPCFWDWVMLSCAETAEGYFRVESAFRFGLNVETGAISNNNEPQIYKNFTRYPTVMRAPQNYRSGQLRSLIGAAVNGKYVEAFSAKEALSELSTSGNRLFLRSRKGDLMEIMLKGPVEMETMDGSAMQAQTAGLEWAEVADAGDVSLIAFEAV